MRNLRLGQVQQLVRHHVTVNEDSRSECCDYDRHPDLLFPHTAQPHPPHVHHLLPEATLKMAAPLRGIKGEKSPITGACLDACHVPEASFAPFSLTFVRGRLWACRAAGPPPLSSAGWVLLPERTGSFQDLLWSSQHYVSGTGLTKFELASHSALRSLLLWQDGVCPHREHCLSASPSKNQRLSQRPRMN